MLPAGGSVTGSPGVRTDVALLMRRSLDALAAKIAAERPPESTRALLHRARRHRIATHRAIDEVYVVGAGRRRREAGHHRGALAMSAIVHGTLRGAGGQMPLDLVGQRRSTVEHHAKRI